MRRDSSRGYTLTELIVTVLLIGILSAIAVPQYLKTVENSKADDAVSLVNMIGTTNKMFALDHSGNYVYGSFSAACGASACPAAAPYNSACALVWCKYLADQDWGNKPYLFTAGSGGSIATALRNGGSAPYSSWGYNMSATGVIAPIGGAPTPTY